MANADRPDPRIVRVLKILNDGDPSTRLRIEKVAKELNISPSYLRHLFRTQVGTTFTGYQKSLRLARAKTLLQTSHLEVKEIVAQVGISDVSHFIRDYKAVFGEIPSETRRRSRSK